MSWFQGFGKMRALFSLMAVLILFLGASATVLSLRQKEFLHDLERTHAVKELELMGTLAREALIKRDYATIVQFLHSWGMNNPDIAAIQAVAPNGFTLALYQKEERATNTFQASRDIFHSGKKLISLRMAKDLSGVDGRVNRLFMQGAAAFLLFAAAMGAALWSTLRRTAILPMEEMVREIRDLNQGLEHRVEERAADLIQANEALKLEMRERRKAEENLRGSKEKLELQNEELRKVDFLKDALVRDISHELKTPVAKHLMQLEILGDILDRIGIRDPVEDVLQVMEEGIRRQQAAIGNILVMSRLEKGGRRLNAVSFRLDTLLEEVINDYMHGIASYGIRLQMELSPVILVSDRDLLWHVFANIVDNAIKYRAREMPQLTVSVTEEKDGPLVQVFDNGTGFSEVECERAFERFYQSSPATEGLGLGLNISMTIVESLGGSIRIDSEGKDKGTTVSVTLATAGKAELEENAPPLEEHS